MINDCFPVLLKCLSRGFFFHLIYHVANIYFKLLKSKYLVKILQLYFNLLYRDWENKNNVLIFACYFLFWWNLQILWCYQFPVKTSDKFYDFMNIIFFRGTPVFSMKGNLICLFFSQMTGLHASSPKFGFEPATQCFDLIFSPLWF